MARKHIVHIVHLQAVQFTLFIIPFDQELQYSGFLMFLINWNQ